MKQVLFISLILIFTVFAAAILFSFTTSTPEEISEHNTRIVLTADQNNYTINEPVWLSLQITNNKKTDLLLTSLEKGITVIFTLKNNQNHSVAQWTQQKTFSETQGDLLLPAHTTYYLNTTWYQTDSSDLIVGTAGTYTLHATLFFSHKQLHAEHTTFTLTRKQPQNLTLTITSDNTTYNTYDEASLTISITNNASANITLLYPSTQKTDFIVKNQDNTSVFHWSDNRSFADVLTYVTIPTNTTQFLLNTTYNLTNHQGKKLPVGSYSIQAWTSIRYAYGTPPTTPSAYIQPDTPRMYSTSLRITIL